MVVVVMTVNIDIGGHKQLLLVEFPIGRREFGELWWHCSGLTIGWLGRYAMYEPKANMNGR